MVVRVSIENSVIVQDTVKAINRVPDELRKQIRSQTRDVAGKAWTRALAEHVTLLPQSRLIASSTRIDVTNQNITVRAAYSKRRAMSGGAIPYRDGKAWEFGNRGDKMKTYKSRNRQGTRFDVTRHTTRQTPDFAPHGLVFYPALAQMMPRILALWTQTTVRTVMESLEGRSHG